MLDVRPRCKSGLDFQSELAAMHILLPIAFIAGHRDIPMSVRAMKGEAKLFGPARSPASRERRAECVSLFGRNLVRSHRHLPAVARARHAKADSAGRSRGVDAAADAGRAGHATNPYARRGAPRKLDLEFGFITSTCSCGF